MKILFDLLSAQPGGGSKFHGGGEYIKRMFKCLLEEYHRDVLIEVYFNRKSFIDGWIIDLISDYNIQTYDVCQRNQVQNIIDEGKYDVFFSGIPYDYNFIKFPTYTKSIGTIHGLRALEKMADKYTYKYVNGKEKLNLLKSIIFPNVKADREKKYFKRTIESFDEFVCVSNHTLYSIKSFFPEFADKKYRVYYTPAKYVSDGGVEKYDLAVRAYGKYILLLGVDRWIKNGYRGIQAIDSLYRDGLLDEYKTVLVGGLPLEIRKKIKFKDKFIFLDYVETEHLEALYKNCDIFLYPSLNEGFGMPPLEAMKYGKTCIVSGVCSIPEICGEAVYYVNPYDISEIRNRILMASEYKIERNKIIFRFNNVLKKQEEDLRKVCEYIIGKEKAYK